MSKQTQARAKKQTPKSKTNPETNLEPPPFFFWGK